MSLEDPNLSITHNLKKINRKLVDSSRIKQYPDVEDKMSDIFQEMKDSQKSNNEKAYQQSYNNYKREAIGKSLIKNKKKLEESIKIELSKEEIAIKCKKCKKCEICKKDEVDKVCKVCKVCEKCKLDNKEKKKVSIKQGYSKFSTENWENELKFSYDKTNEKIESDTKKIWEMNDSTLKHVCMRNEIGIRAVDRVLHRRKNISVKKNQAQAGGANVLSHNTPLREMYDMSCFYVSYKAIMEVIKKGSDIVSKELSKVKDEVDLFSTEAEIKDGKYTLRDKEGENLLDNHEWGQNIHSVKKWRRNYAVCVDFWKRYESSEDKTGIPFEVLDDDSDFLVHVENVDGKIQAAKKLESFFNDMYKGADKLSSVSFDKRSETILAASFEVEELIPRAEYYWNLLFEFHPRMRSLKAGFLQRSDKVNHEDDFLHNGGEKVHEGGTLVGDNTKQNLKNPTTISINSRYIVGRNDYRVIGCGDPIKVSKDFYKKDISDHKECPEYFKQNAKKYTEDYGVGPDNKDLKEKYQDYFQLSSGGIDKYGEEHDAKTDTVKTDESKVYQEPSIQKKSGISLLNHLRQKIATNSSEKKKKPPIDLYKRAKWFAAKALSNDNIKGSEKGLSELRQKHKLHDGLYTSLGFDIANYDQEYRKRQNFEPDLSQNTQNSRDFKSEYIRLLGRRDDDGNINKKYLKREFLDKKYTHLGDPLIADQRDFVQRKNAWAANIHPISGLHSTGFSEMAMYLNGVHVGNHHGNSDICNILSGTKSGNEDEYHGIKMNSTENGYRHTGYYDGNYSESYKQLLRIWTARAKHYYNTALEKIQDAIEAINVNGYGYNEAKPAVYKRDTIGNGNLPENIKLLGFSSNKTFLSHQLTNLREFLLKDGNDRHNLDEFDTSDENSPLFVKGIAAAAFYWTYMRNEGNVVEALPGDIMDLKHTIPSLNLLIDQMRYFSESEKVHVPSGTPSSETFLHKLDMDLLPTKRFELEKNLEILKSNHFLDTNKKEKTKYQTIEEVFAKHPVFGFSAYTMPDDQGQSYFLSYKNANVAGEKKTFKELNDHYNDEHDDKNHAPAQQHLDNYTTDYNGGILYNLRRIIGNSRSKMIEENIEMAKVIGWGKNNNEYYINNYSDLNFYLNRSRDTIHSENKRTMDNHHTYGYDFNYRVKDNEDREKQYKGLKMKDSGNSLEKLYGRCINNKSYNKMVEDNNYYTPLNDIGETYDDDQKPFNENTFGISLAMERTALIVNNLLRSMPYTDEHQFKLNGTVSDDYRNNQSNVNWTGLLSSIATGMYDEDTDAYESVVFNTEDNLGNIATVQNVDGSFEYNIGKTYGAYNRVKNRGCRDLMDTDVNKRKFEYNNNKGFTMNDHYPFLFANYGHRDTYYKDVFDKQILVKVNNYCKDADNLNYAKFNLGRRHNGNVQYLYHHRTNDSKYMRTWDNKDIHSYGIVDSSNYNIEDKTINEYQINYLPKRVLEQNRDYKGGLLDELDIILYKHDYTKLNKQVGYYEYDDHKSVSEQSASNVMFDLCTGYGRQATWEDARAMDCLVSLLSLSSYSNVEVNHKNNQNKLQNIDKHYYHQANTPQSLKENYWSTPASETTSLRNSLLNLGFARDNTLSRVFGTYRENKDLHTGCPCGSEKSRMLNACESSMSWTDYPIDSEMEIDPDFSKEEDMKEKEGSRQFQFRNSLNQQNRYKNNILGPMAWHFSNGYNTPFGGTTTVPYESTLDITGVKYLKGDPIYDSEYGQKASSIYAYGNAIGYLAGCRWSEQRYDFDKTTMGKTTKITINSHGLKNDEYIIISGASDPKLNGTHKVQNRKENTFKINIETTKNNKTGRYQKKSNKNLVGEFVGSSGWMNQVSEFRTEDRDMSVRLLNITNASRLGYHEFAGDMISRQPERLVDGLSRDHFKSVEFLEAALGHGSVGRMLQVGTKISDQEDNIQAFTENACTYYGYLTGNSTADKYPFANDNTHGRHVSGWMNLSIGRIKKPTGIGLFYAQKIANIADISKAVKNTNNKLFGEDGQSYNEYTSAKQKEEKGATGFDDEDLNAISSYFQEPFRSTHTYSNPHGEGSGSGFGQYFLSYGVSNQSELARRLHIFNGNEIGNSQNVNNATQSLNSLILGAGQYTTKKEYRNESNLAHMYSNDTAYTTDPKLDPNLKTINGAHFPFSPATGKLGVRPVMYDGVTRSVPYKTDDDGKEHGYLDYLWHHWSNLYEKDDPKKTTKNWFGADIPEYEPFYGSLSCNGDELPLHLSAEYYRNHPIGSSYSTAVWKNYSYGAVGNKEKLYAKNISGNAEENKGVKGLLNIKEKGDPAIATELEFEYTTVSDAESNQFVGNMVFDKKDDRSQIYPYVSLSYFEQNKENFNLKENRKYLHNLFSRLVKLSAFADHVAFDAGGNRTKEDELDEYETGKDDREYPGDYFNDDVCKETTSDDGITKKATKKVNDVRRFLWNARNGQYPYPENVSIDFKEEEKEYLDDHIGHSTHKLYNDAPQRVGCIRGIRHASIQELLSQIDIHIISNKEKHSSLKSLAIKTVYWYCSDNNGYLHKKYHKELSELIEQKYSKELKKIRELNLMVPDLDFRKLSGTGLVFTGDYIVNLLEQFVFYSEMCTQTLSLKGSNTSKVDFDELDYKDINVHLGILTKKIFKYSSKAEFDFDELDGKDRVITAKMEKDSYTDIASNMLVVRAAALFDGFIYIMDDPEYKRFLDTLPGGLPFCGWNAAIVNAINLNTAWGIINSKTLQLFNNKFFEDSLDNNDQLKGITAKNLNKSHYHYSAFDDSKKRLYTLKNDETFDDLISTDLNNIPIGNSEILSIGEKSKIHVVKTNVVKEEKMNLLRYGDKSIVFAGTHLSGVGYKRAGYVNLERNTFKVSWGTTNSHIKTTYEEEIKKWLYRYCAVIGITDSKLCENVVNKCIQGHDVIDKYKSKLFAFKEHGNIDDAECKSAWGSNEQDQKTNVIDAVRTRSMLHHMRDYLPLVASNYVGFNPELKLAWDKRNRDLFYDPTDLKNNPHNDHHESNPAETRKWLEKVVPREFHGVIGNQYPEGDYTRDTKDKSKSLLQKLPEDIQKLIEQTMNSFNKDEQKTYADFCVKHNIRVDKCREFIHKFMGKRNNVGIKWLKKNPEVFKEIYRSHISVKILSEDKSGLSPLMDVKTSESLLRRIFNKQEDKEITELLTLDDIFNFYDELYKDKIDNQSFMYLVKTIHYLVICVQIGNNKRFQIQNIHKIQEIKRKSDKYGLGSLTSSMPQLMSPLKITTVNPGWQQIPVQGGGNRSLNESNELLIFAVNRDRVLLINNYIMQQSLLGNLPSGARMMRFSKHTIDQIDPHVKEIIPSKDPNIGYTDTLISMIQLYISILKENKLDNIFLLSKIEQINNYLKNPKMNTKLLIKYNTDIQKMLLLSKDEKGYNTIDNADTDKLNTTYNNYVSQSNKINSDLVNLMNIENSLYNNAIVQKGIIQKLSSMTDIE